MKEKEIAQLLKNLSHESDFGGEVSEDHTSNSWVRVSDEIGFDSDFVSESYSYRDYLDYALFSVARTAAKPVAVAMTAIVFVAGGVLTAANASFSSMPGDLMYPVKLAVEEVQLTLAATSEQRAKLQVEFAGRRLEEMTELASSQELGEQGLLLAMDRFRKEAVEIQENLSVETDVEKATELAKAVQRKVEVYSTTITSAPETTVVEEEVQEIIDNTKEQAVEVFLSTHETAQDEESARELAHAFSQDYETAAVLVAGASEEEDVLFTQLFGMTTGEYLLLAQQLADERLYRNAFQVLYELETFLK